VKVHVQSQKNTPYGTLLDRFGRGGWGAALKETSGGTATNRGSDVQGDEVCSFCEENPKKAAC